MPYDCQLLYRPSREAENTADFMSRHPSTSETERHNIAEDYVNYICNNAIPKAMTLQEVKLEIKKDQAMHRDFTDQPHSTHIHTVDNLCHFLGLVNIICATFFLFLTLNG